MDRKLLIVYHSEFGSTEQIAFQIHDWLQEWGYSSVVCRHNEFDPLEEYQAVIAGCPIYGGEMDKQFLSFVSQHAHLWNQLPGMFFMVSLTKAGNDEKSLRELQQIRESISTKTGWHPTVSVDVAGTCWYKKYNFFMRWVLKRINKKSGGNTDTSQNHEYTDWEQLMMFLKGFLDRTKME
jgi:menaquinone-dependent protoporphyrinogen oxidase